MKKIVFYFLLFVSFSTNLIAQKVVLNNGLKRAVIKEGKTIGVTSKAEKNTFVNWKTICDLYSDSTLLSEVWDVDKILNDRFILKKTIAHDSAYVFDTISVNNKKLLKKYQKSWFYVHEIPADSTLGDLRVVFSKPIYYLYKTVLFSELESLTFSKSNSCRGVDLGLPITSLIFIVGSPIVSIDNGKLYAKPLLIGEAIGFSLGYLVYSRIKNVNVKNYTMSEWKLKVK
jgi:hypothetical protein